MRSLGFLAGVLGVSSALPAIIAVLLTAAPGPSQEEADLEPGCLLVADRGLRDPNFAQTVVLVTQYSEQGAIGIVVNRRTEIPVKEALDWQEAKARRELVYAGGPVGTGGWVALVRAKPKPSQAVQLLPEVHLVAARAVVQKSLAAGASTEKLRLYFGYAGWGPEQLEHEVALGAWHLLRGDAAHVFDSDPDSLWSRLIKTTETRIASVYGAQYQRTVSQCLRPVNN